MNIQNMPFDGFNLAQDICQSKNLNSDAHKFLEESKAIYKLINSGNVNNKDLANRLDSIKDIFLKCTKENFPESELSLEEKINLKYAYRDILDQVNSQMHQNATSRNSQQTGPTGFVPIDSQITLALYVGNLAFKALMYTADVVFPDAPNKYEFQTTEEDIIKRVQKGFASIERDKRFDKYEAQLEEKRRGFTNTEPDVKESFTNFFNIKPSQAEIEKNKEKERSINLVNRCIQVKTVMDSEHVRKSQNLSITPPLFDWNGLFDPMLDNVYNALLDCEKVLIGKTLQPYTPEKLFEGKKLSQFLTSTIDTETSKINKFANLLSALGEPIVRDIRKRLSNNLKFITNDYNLARFTISMNTNIVQLFSAVDKLPQNSTQDDLIKALGITDPAGTPLTAAQYIEMAHKDIITNVCKLCILESKESEATVAGFIASRWTSAGNAALEKTLSTIIEKAFNTQDLKELLDQVPRLPASENPMLGWGGSDKINKNMDIILLFLANKLVSEMATIASEARKAERQNLSTDVSGIADEKAVEEVKKSTLEVVKALRNLTLPTAEEYDKIIKEEKQSLSTMVYGTLTNHLTFSFIDYAVNVQGEGHIKDIMTPLYTEFIKKWTAWVSE